MFLYLISLIPVGNWFNSHNTSQGSPTQEGKNEAKVGRKGIGTIEKTSLRYEKKRFYDV